MPLLPLALILALGTSAMASAASPRFLYIGTYGDGIYRASFDPATGAIGEPVLAAKVEKPSFLAFHPDGKRLYAVSEPTAMVHAFAIEADGGLRELNSVPAGGASPCHVAVDSTGKCLLVANYSGATVAALRIEADGRLSEGEPPVRHEGSGAHPSRQKKPHPHGATFSPDERYVLLCDLGIDKIVAYAVDPAEARLTRHGETAVAPGSGPRHLAFSPDGKHAYAIHELSNEIEAFAWDPKAGALTPLGKYSTLPADLGAATANTTAEVAVHPDGKTVYGSNRGHDSLAILARDPATGRLASRGTVPSGGKGPRHFALSPDGRWLIAAHQQTDDLHVFQVAPLDGMLTPAGKTARAPRPVCVLFAP